MSEEILHPNVIINDKATGSVKPDVKDPVENTPAEKPEKLSGPSIRVFTVGKSRNLSYDEAWDAMLAEPAALAGNFARLRLLNRQAVRFGFK